MKTTERIAERMRALEHRVRVLESRIKSAERGIKLKTTVIRKAQAELNRIPGKQSRLQVKLVAARLLGQ